MMNRSTENDGTRRVVTIATVAIVVFWGAACWVALRHPSLDRTPFAEMLFGGLSSLFSGLAFAGVIFAILLQRQELRLQREELEHTRAELRRSAKAQEETRDLQRRQQFDDVRYEAWLRAAQAIEGYEAWLEEWQSLLNPAKSIDEWDSVLKEHARDRRRADLAPALDAANEFFPELKVDFEKFRIIDGSHSLNVRVAFLDVRRPPYDHAPLNSAAREARDGLEALRKHVRASYAKWRRGVLSIVFGPMIRELGANDVLSQLSGDDVPKIDAASDTTGE